MNTVCSRCLMLKHQVSPIGDGQVSHGLCREHELEALIFDGTATVDEINEHCALREDYLSMTISVPPHIWWAIRSICASIRDVTGSTPSYAMVAGLAVAREINRTEYEAVPLSVYKILGTNNLPQRSRADGDQLQRRSPASSAGCAPLSTDPMTPEPS